MLACKPYHKSVLILALVFFTTGLNGQYDAGWQSKVEELMEQQPDSAFSMLERAGSFAIANKDQDLQAWVLKRKGTLYMYIGNNARSIENYLKALELYEQMGDTAGIAGGYMNLGNVADTKEEKIDFQLQSADLYRQIDNQEGVAKNLVNIGTTYLDYGEYDSAKTYFEQAQKLSRDIGYMPTLTSSSLNLAIVFENLQQERKAIHQIKEVLRYYEREDIGIGKVYSYFNLSQIYLRLNDLDSSEYFVQQTLAAAQNTFLNIRQLCFETLSNIAERRGNLKAAIDYQKIQDSLSLANAEVSSQKLFSRMEAEYRVRRKEAAITRLDAEMAQSRYIKWMLFLLMSSTLLFGGISIYLQRDSGRKQQSILLQRKEYAQTQHRLSEADLKIAHLKEKELSAKLKYTEAELVQFAINFVQNNEIVEELRTKLKKLIKGAATRKEVQVLRQFDQSLLEFTDRHQAKSAFLTKAEELNDGFLNQLQEEFPELTSGERELLMLIMLRLNYKEIASIFGVKPSTIIVKRHKIRKKLAMQRGETFEHFIRSKFYRA